uniref:Uncharacterized protein n=1 Tax=Nelumbo nucifera TaxID=4432 RepID=A0A822YV58_NELNU|nr:TPA_asm: hypothetical protein HUJ06_008585 [Nelumbo nucifera]
MVSVISVENPELPYTAGPTQLSFVSPATVKSTRGTHSSNCDWDAHGGCSSSSSSSLHDRRPLEGFSGCPSAVDLSSILGFEDVGNKSLLLMGDAMDDCLVVSGPYGSMGMADSFTDELVRDTPVVSFDDLIVSSDSTHNFLPMVVPPLPKEISLWETQRRDITSALQTGKVGEKLEFRKWGGRIISWTPTLSTGTKLPDWICRYRNRTWDRANLSTWFRCKCISMAW